MTAPGHWKNLAEVQRLTARVLCPQFFSDEEKADALLFHTWLRSQGFPMEALEDAESRTENSH